MMKLVAIALILCLAFSGVTAQKKNGKKGKKTTAAPEVVEEAAIPSIVENAIATPVLSTLVSVLTMPEYAGILEALSGDGPFTVFAPTDDAFEAAGVDVSNVEAVSAVLTYHVVAGAAVYAGDLQAEQNVATLNGAELNILAGADGVTVNGANVVVADVASSNGVVHVIDAVLLPPVAAVVTADDCAETENFCEATGACYNPWEGTCEEAVAEETETDEETLDEDETAEATMPAMKGQRSRFSNPRICQLAKEQHPEIFGDVDCATTAGLIGSRYGFGASGLGFGGARTNLGLAGRTTTLGLGNARFNGLGNVGLGLGARYGGLANGVGFGNLGVRSNLGGLNTGLRTVGTTGLRTTGLGLNSGLGLNNGLRTVGGLNNGLRTVGGLNTGLNNGLRTSNLGGLRNFGGRTLGLGGVRTSNLGLAANTASTVDGA